MALEIANTSIINNGIVVSDDRDLFANTLSVQRYYSTFLGEVYGYSSGGFNPPATVRNGIERFPYGTTTTSSLIAALSVSRFYVSGESSADYGYASGGGLPGPAVTNVIDRFPFASTANATDVGDLSITRAGSGGASSSENGYHMGAGSTAISNVIDRWPFAVATTNATDVGDLTLSLTGGGGMSSQNYGYYACGNGPGGATTYSSIDRFPFAVATTNATNIGNMTVAGQGRSGVSSAEYGYCAGSTGPLAPAYNVIDRFPFAADVVSGVDVGDLSPSKGYSSTQSSFFYGFSSGGLFEPGALGVANIQTWPFAQGTVNASVAGSLTVNTQRNPSGQNN